MDKSRTMTLVSKQEVSNKISFYLSSIFCLLFIATQFVNKYVLSVLKFTFPTIFQGGSSPEDRALRNYPIKCNRAIFYEQRTVALYHRWQTLVGAIFLRVLVSSGKVKPLLKDTSRSDIAKWLPGMMLFVFSIYSGSKALANLPIPVFASLHNLLIVVKFTVDLALHKKILGIMNYMFVMVLIISSVAVVRTDPDFNQEGYFWMCLHLVSMGLYEIVSKLVRGRLKFTTTEILYSNYIYSVIVLAPSSYFLGDALEASNFPFLYFSKFYMGCIFSGIFGVALNLTAIKIKESESSSHVDMVRLQGVAKLFTSMLSLLLFDIELTANYALWLTVNHLVGVACENSVTERRELTIGNISIKKRSILDYESDDDPV